METIKSLYQCFLDGGVPLEEISHHYSDLYVKVSLKSKRILEEFRKQSSILEVVSHRESAEQK